MAKKPMTADQFQHALDAIRCSTYDDAARVTGVGRRSLVRYGTGELPVPPVLERLLAMFIRHGVPREYVK